MNEMRDATNDNVSIDCQDGPETGAPKLEGPLPTRPSAKRDGARPDAYVTQWLPPNNGDAALLSPRQQRRSTAEVRTASSAASNDTARIKLGMALTSLLAEYRSRHDGAIQTAVVDEREVALGDARMLADWFIAGAESAVAVHPAIVVTAHVEISRNGAPSTQPLVPLLAARVDELARQVARLLAEGRVHQRIEHDRSRFRASLAHSNVSVFEQDAGLRYRWVHNPWFGRRPEHMLGRTDNELLPPDQAAVLTIAKRRVIATGIGAHEETVLSSHGEKRPCLVVIDPLNDASGTVVGVVGSISDIKAPARARAERSPALASFEQRVGILGHDLRNPLSAVGLSAEFLQRMDGLPTDAHAPILLIRRATRRMVEMVRTLLDFSHSRFIGHLSVLRVPTDFHSLCRHMVDELAAAHPEASIEVDMTGDARGAWDPSRLEQLVSNIVGNALAHGAKQFPIQVSVRSVPTGIVFAVTNGGPPIPSEILPTLFEPFSHALRPATPSPVKGLGLGLFIAREVADAHNGSIRIESSAEHGTTVTVWLPRGAGTSGAPERGLVRT